MPRPSTDSRRKRSTQGVGAWRRGSTAPPSLFPHPSPPAYFLFSPSSCSLDTSTLVVFGRKEGLDTDVVWVLCVYGSIAIVVTAAHPCTRQFHDVIDLQLAMFGGRSTIAAEEVLSKLRSPSEKEAARPRDCWFVTVVVPRRRVAILPLDSFMSTNTIRLGHGPYLDATQ